MINNFCYIRFIMYYSVLFKHYLLPYIFIPANIVYDDATELPGVTLID